MTHRYYSPSQLKKMFNSCCSRKMQVALSAPNFPKCIMRDVLESETPRFVAGYYANAKSIESMAQMLNHPAFSDNEVSELLALNPALDVILRWMCFHCTASECQRRCITVFSIALLMVSILTEM